MIDISKELAPAFFKNPEFKKGKVIGFQQGDSVEHYKIVRLNRAKKICMVEPIKLYTEDEINDMNREDAEEIIQGKRDED
jgi:hypothetical protein